MDQADLPVAEDQGLEPLVGPEAVEQGVWLPEEVQAQELPGRYGYVRSPASLQAARAAGSGPA